ncbi:MAG: glutaredoxin family protein, partial [Kocuria sp.]|nr:glutaredoxin family protein [Kocuria sp.]
AGLDPAEAKELADQISWSSSDANELEAELDDVSAAENSESGPEWATDSVDQPFTPERVTADWVQSTTMVETYLETDRLDLARQWIDELDENLQAFEDGEVPPGSDELYSVYHDAVARAAIPYGQAPIAVDEVQRQLGNVGINVPHFDLDHIREATGIMPLGRDHVTAKLDQEAAPPTGLEDVAAARLSVRRALTEAVDMMRPEQTHANVTAAQESVKQASERVDAVAETAKNVETEATLYTVPDCPGCFATKRAMDKAGVEYEEIDLSTNPELLQQFKRQSLAQAPIVETQDGDRWSGYNPTKLREHGLDYRSRQQRGNDSGRDTGHGR